MGSETEPERTVAAGWEPILRKEAERQLMEKMRKVALEGCKEEVQLFAECATGKTFSVIWKCREQKQVANNCMRAYRENEALKAEMRLKHALKYPRSVKQWKKVDCTADAGGNEGEAAQSV